MLHPVNYTDIIQIVTKYHVGLVPRTMIIQLKVWKVDEKYPADVSYVFSLFLIVFFLASNLINTSV